MTKAAHYFYFLFLSIGYIRAQSIPVAEKQHVVRVCDCPRSNNSFDSEDQAREIVNKLAALVDEKIDNVSQAPCTNNAIALKCNGFKYILYNHDFLESLKKGAPRAEQFIMAHEIGHHLHKHTEGKNVFTKIGTYTIAIDQNRQVYAFKIRNSKGRESGGDTIRKYRREFSNLVAYYQHIKEFQADATATWIMYQRGIQKKDLEDVWEQYAIQTNRDQWSWTAEHPGIYVRKKLTSALWQALYEQQKTSSSKPIKKVKKYVTRVLSVESINEFIADASRNSFGPGTSAQLTLDEKIFWDFVRKKHALVVEPIAGYLLSFEKWQPKISKENALSAQFTGKNTYAGVRFSRMSWYSPLWLEGSIVYKSFGFQTYNDSELEVEQFRWHGIQLTPQALFTTAGNPSNYKRSKWGGYISVGGALNIPLSLRYQNHYLTNTPTSLIAAKIQVAPVFEIGCLQINRNYRRGNFRLGITYQPQRVILKDYSAYIIHVPQIGIHGSARFW